MDRSKFLKAYGAATGRPVSGLLSSAYTPEAIMSRRKRKGKTQSSDMLGDLSNMPQYIQDMALAGRDDDGNISSRAASRGAGFTNKEVATAMANYGQMMDERAYEQSLWEERESLQGQVKQAQEAGINPAMLAGGYSAGSGSPVSGGGDAGVSGESAYDEFGGGLDMLSQLIGLFTGAAQITNQVRGTNQQIKASKQQVANETATTEANNAHTQAETDLIKEQTEGQRNLNSNFWRKADDEHAIAVVEQAAKKAGIDKVTFDMDMAKKMYNLEERSVAVKEMEAENGGLLIRAQVAKLMADIDLTEAQTSLTETEDINAMDLNKQMEIQLKKLKEEVHSLGYDNAMRDVASEYNIPVEFAPFVLSQRVALKDKAFAMWMSGFREALANRASAFTFIYESTHFGNVNRKEETTVASSKVKKWHEKSLSDVFGD